MKQWVFESLRGLYELSRRRFFFAFVIVFIIFQFLTTVCCKISKSIKILHNGNCDSEEVNGLFQSSDYS